MSKRKPTPIGDDINNIPAARTSMSGGFEFSKIKCTARNREDCLDAIEILKHSHPSSWPLIHKIVTVAIAVGEANFGMLQAGLQGQTFTDYSLSMGTSRQAAYQRWERVAKKVPEVARVFSRRKEDDANDNT